MAGAATFHPDGSTQLQRPHAKYGLRTMPPPIMKTPPLLEGTAPLACACQLGDSARADRQGAGGQAGSAWPLAGRLALSRVLCSWFVLCTVNCPFLDVVLIYISYAYIFTHLYIISWDSCIHANDLFS